MHGLLDTNILILRRRIDHARLPETMSISAVTLAELSAGPHHTADPVERARRMDVLQRAESEFDPLPFDAEAARAFGTVAASVLAAGRKPRARTADLMIASVAIANRLPIYTTNPDDFAGLDALLTVVAVPLSG
ncbi:type II toxin-antitoxin system VapC family toxin [Natronosporangium hydrolyticum]|uniref:type II toxin-antitoxin system VapC family toxin n=1 Tax=Natronosporangium hydrolyticum TaxID=2811111 RepID=UPI001EFA216F|nr:type II toxin-antitoxin system VapC family toxin [Natronosporangium hydrolyticum]